MLEVRNVRTLGAGGSGNTGLVPPRIARGSPSGVPEGSPVPSMPMPDPPGGCDVGSSTPILMTGGTRDGCIRRPGSILVWTAEVPAFRGAGSGATCPTLIGVETVRTDGSPTVLHSGSKSSKAITSACSPNDVSVVQLLRVRWHQEVSSMLSANIVSSSAKSFAGMDTANAAADDADAKKKGRVFTRPVGTFGTPLVSGE